MLQRLIGVYNADGGLPGEIAYVVGHVLGLAECSLCDITHSPLRRKPQWDALVASLPVEFQLLHRNEVSAELQQWLADKPLPLVVGETAASDFVLVLDSVALAECNGSIDAFRRALRESKTGL